MADPILIHYEVKGDPELVLRRAMKVARENGADISGDSRSGTVTKGGLLKLKGRYIRTGNTIEMTINEWPFIASRDDVRKEILGWLERNDV